MWAMVAVAVSAIGAGVSAYGQYETGQSAKKAAEYNAEMDRRAAADALNRGATEAAAIKDKTRRTIAQQIAAQSAAGFDSSTGTALDISVETAGFGELDALKTMNNAQRVAAGQEAQAELDLFQGRAAGTAGTLNGTGTLLQGAGSFFGSSTGRELLAKWNK